MEKNKTVSGLKKQLAAAIAMVLVAAISLGTSTYAWFVSNTKVSATSSSVKATSATPNLLIVEGAKTVGGTDGSTYEAFDQNGKTTASISSTEATALYPASTNNCKNWWVVNDWTTGVGSTGALASRYRDISNDIAPATAITGDATPYKVRNGTYTQGGKTLNAYQVSTYSVYTTTGEVDLNLDPENPIIVDVKQDGTPTITGTGFKDALRVGIVVNGELKLVYAPTDNEKDGAKGNDETARTGWRNVKDASNTQEATYKIVAADTYTGWTATNNNDGTYIKAGNSLGTVNTDGAVVQVYVWLEGTDSDCLVGKADVASDDDTYQVTLNLVGATVNPAP